MTPQPPKDPANAGESDELEKALSEFEELLDEKIDDCESVAYDAGSADTTYNNREFHEDIFNGLQRVKAAIQAQLDAAVQKATTMTCTCECSQCSVLGIHRNCTRVGNNLCNKYKRYTQAHVDEAVREARLDELRTISGGKYLRNIHTVVEDANGDVYEDDYRSYISDYEVQERIEQLTTQSKSKENE